MPLAKGLVRFRSGIEGLLGEIAEYLPENYPKTPKRPHFYWMFESGPGTILRFILTN